MPIYDQSFRRYEGPRSTATLWWTVALQTLRPVFKSKLTWLLTSFVIIQLIIVSVGFFVAGQVKEFVPDAETAQEALRHARKRKLPVFSDAMSMNTVLSSFIMPNLGVLWLMVAAAGSGAVSLDKKHNAFPLYFSRPLRPWQYLLGKILGLTLFPSAVLMIGTLLVYIQMIAYLRPASALVTELPALMRGIISILMMCGMTALVMVGFSSMTKRAGIAVISFFAFWIASEAIAAGVLTRVLDNKSVGLFSLGRALRSFIVTILKPDAEEVDPEIGAIAFPLAMAAIALYGGFFLWIARRNLKVVEVVK